MSLHGPLALACAVMLAASCTASAPPSPKKSALEGTAGVVDAYRTWVAAQVDSLVAQTEAFTAAVEAGSRARAQELYAPARMPYERIEPVAEALGDLDPRIDARENDVPADQWGGFHKLEKLLWSKDDLKAGIASAQRLRSDVHLLRAKVETADLSLASMVTGAVELLNEVSTKKITGEEERYSHTDLWDVQANAEGSAKIFELLSSAVQTADPELAATLKDRFAALFALLDTHKRGGGYKLYGELKPDEVKAVSHAVDAVAEPLAQLGGLVPEGSGN